MPANTLLLLSILVIITGCASTPQPASIEHEDRRPTAPAEKTADQTHPPADDDAKGTQPIALDSGCDTSISSAPVMLQAGHIENDRLHLTARFGGGCEVHEFSACWNGSFMESFPVQVRIEVVHNDKGDACKAMVHEDLQLDLSALREAYQKAYQTEQGIIVIRLAGVDQTIEYRF